MTKIDLYSDSYTINYREGDSSLQRRAINHEADIDDKLYIVIQGDTITSIAYRFYRIPQYWFIIADANNLINPFNIEMGDSLIIPNLDKYEVL